LLIEEKAHLTQGLPVSARRAEVNRGHKPEIVGGVCALNHGDANAEVFSNIG
jgi:hypothetical protein